MNTFYDKCLKWDKRYMQIAIEVSKWSKDPSTKVGAVIVGKKGQIVSQGYNGFPRGIKDSWERLNTRETKYKFILHAEMNAILNALYNGSSVNDCTIYVHGLPVCNECAKAVIQSGIKRVVYDTLPSEKWKESTNYALNMFKECFIETDYLDMSK